MASFKEAGETLGQFCVAYGWHNVTFEVAEIESLEDGENVAFALFVEKKDKSSKAIKAFFDYSGARVTPTSFMEVLDSVLKTCR